MSERSGPRPSGRRPRPSGRRLDIPPLAVALGLLVLLLTAGALLRLSGGHPLPGGGDPSSTRGRLPLFYDSFDGEALDHTRWRSGGEGGVFLAQGDLVLDGSLVARWGDPGVYSMLPLAPTPGRTVVAVARPNVGTIRGPLFLMSPQPFPSDPTVSGYGAGFDSLGGDAGNGGSDLRLTAVSSEGQVLYHPQEARPIDYVVATTLNPTGAYHFVSGGAFGAFPTATLIWVGSDTTNSAANSDLYVGADAKRGRATASSIKVVDLGPDFARPYGLAKARDSFDRADSARLGSTELGGFRWMVPTGDLRLASGGAMRARAVEARAVFDAGVADGIFEMTVKTPAAPFASPSLYFRYQDENNWWRFRCNTNNVEILRAVGGREDAPYQSESAGCPAESSIRVVVQAHGRRINVWLNGTNTTFSEGVADDTHATATHVGFGFGAEGTSPLVDQLVVWPKTVTLPPETGPAPSVAERRGRPVVQDTFVEAGRTRLQNHRVDVGGPWREYSGQWTVDQRRLIPSVGTATNADALAAVATGLTDMAVTATVVLPGPGGAGAAGDWIGGPILRYTAGKSFVWARLVYRPVGAGAGAGAQVELWETTEGGSRFLGASDVGGLVAGQTRHTITVAAVGQRVSVFLDDVLVMEGLTSVGTGTWAGLLVSGAAVAGAAFERFEVTGVKADTVAPPPVVELSAIASPSAAPLSLAWTPSVDDASGTRYYRVFRSLSAGSQGTQVNTDGETTGTTYSDSRVSGGMSYCYTVAAVDGTGNMSTAGSAQRCVTSGPAAPS